jgi:hypothetical protein
MLANYIKIALRHILGDKFYSSVHIIGLATGIACCVLALLVVSHELAYDRFHLKAERIYRVLRERSGGSESQVRWLSSGALASAASIQCAPATEPTLLKMWSRAKSTKTFFASSIFPCSTATLIPPSIAPILHSSPKQPRAASLAQKIRWVKCSLSTSAITAATTLSRVF